MNGKAEVKKVEVVARPSPPAGRLANPIVIENLGKP